MRVARVFLYPLFIKLINMNNISISDMAVFEPQKFKAAIDSYYKIVKKSKSIPMEVSDNGDVLISAKFTTIDFSKDLNSKKE